MRYLICAVLVSLVVPALAQDNLSLSGVRCVAVDSRQNVWVGSGDRRLLKITPDGKPALVIDGWKKFIKNLTVNIDYMAIDTQDNLYVIQSRDNLIRKIKPTGEVSLFAGQPYDNRAADGPLTKANFRSLDHLVIDRAGNLYVLDADEKTVTTNLTYKNYLLRRISPAGEVTTIREQATGEKMWLSMAGGLAVDAAGNLFFSDANARCIKKITLTSNGQATLSTVAGQCGKREFHPEYVPGNVNTAELFTPGPIAFSPEGVLHVADVRLHRIIKIAGNNVTDVAGNSVVQRGVNMGGRATEGYKDGPARQALFNFPPGVALAFDSRGQLYIVDGGNNCLRKLSTNGIVSTFAR